MWRPDRRPESRPSRESWPLHSSLERNVIDGVFRAAPRSTDPQSVMPCVLTVTEGVISARIGLYAPLRCAYPGVNHQARDRPPRSLGSHKTR